MAPTKKIDETALKADIKALYALNAEYKALDIRYDEVAKRILAVMPPKDTRQYGLLRCVIVQQLRRTVDWKAEASKLARIVYPTAFELRTYLQKLARRYKRKAIKPSVKVTMVKEQADA